MPAVPEGAGDDEKQLYQPCERAARPLLTVRDLAMADSRHGLNRGRERRASVLESVT